MEQNKTGKYLKYAIGEIVLVAIGILIALSVAEWNNTRHDIETENRLLKELQQGIIQDLKTIKTKLEKTNTAINNLILLDSLLKLDIPKPSANLNVLFGNVFGMKSLSLNKALYEDLKSVGFGVIRDEKLRKQIINVFENNYKNFELQKESEEIINQVIRPYYLTNFVSIQFSKYATPKNVKALWEDSYYKNILNYRLVTLQGNQKVNYENAIIEIKKLLELLEQNIK